MLKTRAMNAKPGEFSVCLNLKEKISDDTFFKFKLNIFFRVHLIWLDTLQSLDQWDSLR